MDDLFYRDTICRAGVNYTQMRLVGDTEVIEGVKVVTKSYRSRNGMYGCSHIETFILSNDPRCKSRMLIHPPQTKRPIFAHNKIVNMVRSCLGLALVPPKEDETPMMLESARVLKGFPQCS